MPYRGKVVDGSIVVDERIDAAEGTEVRVYLPGEEPEIHLDPELAAELDAAMDEADRGEWIDGEEFLRKLRAGM